MNSEKIKFENLYERFGKFRVFIVFLLLMILIGTISVLIDDTLEKSFVISGAHFKFTGREDNKYYFKGPAPEYIIAVDLDYTTDSTLFRDISVQEGSKVYKRIKDLDTLTNTFYVDNQPLLKEDIINISVKGSHHITFDAIHPERDSYGVQLIKHIDTVIDHILSNVSLHKWFFVVFLMLIGISEMMYSKFFWQIKFSFAVENGEPSESYLLLSKLTGGVFVCAGVIFPFIEF
ncbi:hypothetical protein [Fusibacter ferrireducens]|uniref:DUF6199 domain-containing protein n=1 Tax=Fusibacter ferrireducens TaxID=2785058 RepID=A0ABR9ZN89_9FIRM|nr:hypothetical protein [Fusibacter ferrireducens]MBF4691933.1 hypothetical protein [Fusibacter ferrireducens]